MAEHSERRWKHGRRLLQVVFVAAGSALARLAPGSAEVLDTESGSGSVRPAANEERGPSLTALSAANYRAVHQLFDQPLVFDDPLALRIIGPQAEAALRADPQRAKQAAALRALLVVRSRYAEDELARAVERGVRQYVVLGAGFDTFAYRNPYPTARLRVFEVDHPATQAGKRRRLGEVAIAVPESLTFAPVDFEKETLADGLRRAGFKTDEPAFFSLLGVVVYLTRDAALETLQFVASMPAGSEIVFDYSVPSSALGDRERAGRELLAQRVAAVGEPWRTFFDPTDLAHELTRLGFSRVQDLTPAEANRRYLDGRADGMRVSNGTHLMLAGR
jgi:methyltransferase (TIGR00027 family)